jgi:hypothetical protein
MLPSVPRPFPASLGAKPTMIQLPPTAAIVDDTRHLVVLAGGWTRDWSTGTD